MKIHFFLMLIASSVAFNRAMAQECCGCSCGCNHENRLPHEGGGQLLRGKAGSKGEKGDAGETPVCDCSSFQATIDAMQTKLDSLVAMSLRNCRQIQQSNPGAQSGIYTIYPSLDSQSYEVMCDMETDGGGWTVFQSRFDGSENFQRDWNDYVNGFGGMKNGGEFWMGLTKLHQLTAQEPCELRIDLTDFDGGSRYAKYGSFSVGHGTDYRLTVGDYSGDAGDGMVYHNNQRFSTRDRDQDVWPKNCAETFAGAFWYQKCHQVNLNGLYLRGTTDHDQYATGMTWKLWRGHDYALRTSKMMFRPVRN